MPGESGSIAGEHGRRYRAALSFFGGADAFSFSAEAGDYEAGTVYFFGACRRWVDCASWLIAIKKYTQKNDEPRWIN
jgi:hypothetical protein